MQGIYDKINELEKSDVQILENYHHKELFESWLIIALMLLGLEFIISRMVLNRIP